MLTGNRVILREKRLEDCQDDYRWRSDPELARLDATMPLRMSFSEFSQAYRNELRYPTPWARRYAIDTVDGVHIGNCMCYDIDTIRREGEVGIMIGDKRYWSQGYGYKAMVLLVDQLFATLSLERLYLHTLEWNTRARRCFEKAGFQQVDLVRRNGHSFAYMELWHRRWREIRQSQLALAGTTAGPSER
ncbi:MAG: GNAT family N-acetyltransferase [Dehalococcoidia bacterium]